MKRYRISKRKSRRDFRKKSRSSQKNEIKIMRGGYRL